jgi:hypothetical protein
VKIVVGFASLTSGPHSPHLVTQSALSPYVIEWIAKLCRDALGVNFLYW